MPVNSHIKSLSAYVPDDIVTNDDLSRIVDTTDQWIVERTGIRMRRKLAAHENTSDLGLKAAKESLDMAAMDADNLTHVVVATCTPNYLSPSVACIIAGELTDKSVMAFDISAACTGFVYGLSICRSLLFSDPDAQILFICAEALSRRVNWQDRSTCVLFGDGATACIMSATADNSLFSIQDVLCQSDGKQKELIIVGGGTACNYAYGDPVEDGFFITMQGRDTYKHAVRQMVNVCDQILKRNNLKISDINLVIPHQANIRIIEAVAARLDISLSHVFTNVGDYGNTSAASIPLAICEARASNKIHKNDLVLITAFGAGLTFGAALLKF